MNLKNHIFDFALKRGTEINARLYLAHGAFY